MNVSIIILTIIIIMMIIIFLSLISYNMYKLNSINSEQKNIIKNIEDNRNIRFSNSIFMTNMKNIFFRFNNFLIHDILKKICKDAEFDNYLVKCNKEIKNRQFNDKKIKEYNTKINDMWNIIITTIKKIETPFYHKYTNNEIDNMIKEKISLDKYIKGENQVMFQVNSTSLIINANVKIFKIYIDIITDLIDYVTNDEELKEILFEKFKYIIETIIIAFLGENLDDILLILTGTGTREGKKDRLLTKFSETYTKFDSIDIEDEFDKSVHRFYETPKYRNKKNDVEDITNNTLQQGAKHLKYYFKNNYSDNIPEHYNNNQISYKLHDGFQVPWVEGERVHVFRLYESAKPDNWTPETLPDFKDISIMDSYLNEREKMIIKDEEKYRITAAELLAEMNSK